MESGIIVFKRPAEPANQENIDFKSVIGYKKASTKKKEAC